MYSKNNTRKSKSKVKVKANKKELVYKNQLEI